MRKIIDYKKVIPQNRLIIDKRYINKDNKPEAVPIILFRQSTIYSTLYSSNLVTTRN